MKTVTLLTAVTLFTSDAFAHCAGLGSASDGSCNIFIGELFVLVRSLAACTILTLLKESF
ncbi:hypothetical protein PtrM4_127660 [Pyrenophora tritici-repentis]|uniref:Uncharacterized protein n=1 Tax=Pyrenophora tritici-repentis TaxID=45151 RepID=A0A834RQA2_9PLEO|nr:hypothetical protein PtrM4_127660 [Pyrenophora tritici-repentis]